MDHGPDLSALAPVWVEALERKGLTLPARVAIWLDEHHEPPPQDRVDLVARRMRREVGVMDMAAEQGVPHSRIQTILHETGLRLIAPHLQEVVSWARARASRIGDESIAELAGTSPEVIRLALDGWPGHDPSASDAQVIEAYTQWIGGAPLAEVAAIIGTTPRRLGRELDEGTSSLPRRLQSRDLADRFGWNKATVTRHRREARLPAPDGRDGLAYWWWAATIDRWVEDRETHVCRSCHLSDSHIWDASTVAALDGVQAKYERRGKTVKIVGLNQASADRHELLSGRLGGGH